MGIAVRKYNIKARTTGQLKRDIKGAVNPFYGKQGMGTAKAIAKHGVVGGLVKQQQRKNDAYKRRMVKKLSGGLLTYHKPKKRSKRTTQPAAARPMTTKERSLFWKGMFWLFIGIPLVVTAFSMFAPFVLIGCSVALFVIAYKKHKARKEAAAYVAPEDEWGQF